MLIRENVIFSTKIGRETFTTNYKRYQDITSFIMFLMIETILNAAFDISTAGHFEKNLTY